MVRVKERYMLVNILYPNDIGKRDVPDVVALHQPTTEELSPPALIRAIKAEVAALFGDYGAGGVERNVQGTSFGIGVDSFAAVD